MKFKLLLILVFIHFIPTYGQGAKHNIEDRMQKVLDEGIKKYNVNGTCATVVFPDGYIWTGVSGISHDTVSIKPDMLFSIGSITKNIIAALTLKLVEEKVLSLEDPLSKWLPSYPNVDSMITIRQLLNHTSGLYMFWDNDQLWDELKNDRSRIWSPEEVLGYIKEPYFTAGSGWRYSNTNYLLMAMIINEVTGSNLSTLLGKYFWQPMGMKNIYISQENSIPDNQVHVYGDNFQFGDANLDVTFQPRAAHESITYGSAGIFINTDNLARWSQALFEGKVLEKQSMDEMLQYVDFESFANMSAYGLGVQVYDPNFTYGKMAIGHGGGNIGTSTYMVYLPEFRISIVVMINAYPSKCVDVITKGLIRIILKDLKAISFFQSFNFFPTGFLYLCIFISFTIMLIFYIRKRKIAA